MGTGLHKGMATPSLAPTILPKEEMELSCAALTRRGEALSFPLDTFFFNQFLTESEFTFLRRLSHHLPIYSYLLSPCALFWSDLRSDRETARLGAYWQARLNPASPSAQTLDELLRDRHPLLANFGRLGREMSRLIEESQAQTEAHYFLPQSVNALEEELFCYEDLHLMESSSPLSLLQALQADLLLMRPPEKRGIFNFEQEQGSIQLHLAPTRRREVQILYHNLLHLMQQHPSLSPSEVIVMAPQIDEYVPYIQSLFGSQESSLDFQILDLGMATQNESVQDFLLLINLSESRWDAMQLLQLFERSSFQRRHRLTAKDYSLIRQWIKQTGIHWGENPSHRNELLQRRHCEQGMVEEADMGTWEYGLRRLLLGLTTAGDPAQLASLEVPPTPSLDFSQGDALGRWIHLLHSLRDDLSPLHNQTQMTIGDWVDYFLCLIDNYFQPEASNLASREAHEELKGQLERLRQSSRFVKDSLFSFTSVKGHLFSLLHHRGASYRENHLHAIRFCSLTPLRAIPAKVIALLGMQEEAFPRTGHSSSLNFMLGKDCSEYCPSSVDDDRYLFLEAIHSAQDYLLISYQGYHQRDHKESQPSLLVEELFSYLDKCYTIQGAKISDHCIVKHPFDAFDARYFQSAPFLHNFSSHHFAAAQSLYSSSPLPSHCFLDRFQWKPSSFSSCSHIDLRHLMAAIKNPIKFHLNQRLGIYLQSEKDRHIQREEELVISSLDKYDFKQRALTDSFDQLLYRADRQGKLPFGLFKMVAIKKLKEEVDDLHGCLHKHQIHSHDIFQIEFCGSCSHPTQVDENQWLLPPLTFSDGNDRPLSLTGKLSHVTSRGLVVLNRGTLVDAWKAWPQFLLYCYATTIHPLKLEPKLIFTHGKTKQASFGDPALLLKPLIQYYFLCLDRFSPLLPEWLPLILDSDAKGLEDKMRQIYSNTFATDQSQEIRWVLNQTHLPNGEQLIQEWKPQAECLLKDFLSFWYS